MSKSAAVSLGIEMCFSLIWSSKLRRSCKRSELMPWVRPRFGTRKSRAFGSALSTNGSNFEPRHEPNCPGVIYTVLSQCGAGVITYGGTDAVYPSCRASQPTSVPKQGISVRLGLISVLSMRYGLPTIDQYMPDV